ncbi:hypothetical protein HK102_007946, partial [Quaeritorhiza haematococci]
MDSDEYARSKNCAREFHFAVDVCRLPIIPIVVGDKWTWRRSKIGFLIADQLYIDCTEIVRFEEINTALSRVIKRLKGTSAVTRTRRTKSTLPKQPKTLKAGQSNTDPTKTHHADGTDRIETTTDQEKQEDNEEDALPLFQVKSFTLETAKVGDWIECLRCNNEPAPRFVYGGLHWEPVKILDVQEIPAAATPVPTDPTQQHRPRRRFKVSFHERVLFTRKTRQEVLQHQYFEWVDEEYLRPCSDPSTMEELASVRVGDPVEFRKYVSRGGGTDLLNVERMQMGWDINTNAEGESSTVTASGDKDDILETGSLASLDETRTDSADWLPAFVIGFFQELFLLRIADRFAPSQNWRSFPVKIGPQSARMLRVGHDDKMLNVLEKLQARELFITPTGGFTTTPPDPNAVKRPPKLIKPVEENTEDAEVSEEADGKGGEEKPEEKKEPTPTTSYALP